MELKEAVAKVNFSDVQLTEEFKSEYEKYLDENNANGYFSVEWAKFSTKITTSTGKIIFITNFWFYIASKLSGYLDGLSHQKEIFSEIYKGADLQEIANMLRGGVPDDQKVKIQKYFSYNGLSGEELENFLSFVSDYKSWGGGKTIDRNDYYVSPLLQAGNLLAETQSAVAEIAKQMSENPSLKSCFKPIFSPCKSSDEKPILGDEILKSSIIRNFIKDIFLYIFDKGRAGSLLAYVQVSQKNDGRRYFELVKDNRKINRLFLLSEKPLADDELISGRSTRYFSESFNYENQFLYLTNQWADTEPDSQNSRDLGSFAIIFNSIYKDLKIIKSDGSYLLVETKKTRMKVFTLSKPFLLLAGISGTGKTRFVREQAKSSGQLSETYCLTSVRPDWHEPSDILGYISRLSSHGQAEYITTDVLQFIAKAWRGIADKGLTIEVQDCHRQGKRLVVTGDSTALNDVLPYWLCLDEMNLAPVEQYFADYLSVLETREWLWEEDTFIYFSDALLKPATINAVADTGKLRADLGFDSSDYDELWQLICEYGLAIPFNLMVAGTVNMDETTHGFSRKVIDRALSVDFGAFFPNSYDDFLSDPPAIVHKTLSYPIWSNARNSVVLLDATADVKGIKSIAFLTAVNTVLKNTPFELAFRALNELLLAVISSQPQDELTLKAVWDDFMMCKVLPRIEGDSDKLATATGENVLAELNKVLAEQLSPIWNADKDSDQANQRPDLYREQSGAENALETDKVLRIACRSKGKLEWMTQRLDSATFTSFWP
jgi:hypothetical protein